MRDPILEGSNNAANVAGHFDGSFSVNVHGAFIVWAGNRME